VICGNSLVYGLVWFIVFNAGFELTTLVVIGTDCIGSYKTQLPYEHDHDGPILLN